MFYNKKLKGEIATTLTIVAVILMGAGALIGSKLTQQPQTIGLKAADGTCYLSAAPQLVKEGASIYCDVVINNPPNPPPTRINCTLINPSRSSDSQILTNSVFFRWYGAGETPSNTLRFKLSQRSDYATRLSPGNVYRLVAYRLAENWSTSLCDKTQDYTSLSSFFGGTAAPTNPPNQPTATQAPTSPPQATNTPFPTPTIVVQCTSASVRGFCSNTNCSEALETGGNYIPSYNKFNCDQAYGSDYVCCVREAVYSTPIPTWTPVPTATPKSPTLLPTPSSAPPTSTPKPLPPDIKITSCNKINNINFVPGGITFVYEDILYYFSFTDLPNKPHIFADLDCLNP